MLSLREKIELGLKYTWAESPIRIIFFNLSEECRIEIAKSISKSFINEESSIIK